MTYKCFSGLMNALRDIDTFVLKLGEICNGETTVGIAFDNIVDAIIEELDPIGWDNDHVDPFVWQYINVTFGVKHEMPCVLYDGNGKEYSVNDDKEFYDLMVSMKTPTKSNKLKKIFLKVKE